MRQLRNATIAVIVLGIVGCTQAQRQADQSKQPPKPYKIQRDVLGESLESFVANNPSCKPRAGSGHSDHTKPALAGTQYCVIGGTTYAGMPLIARLADFYQGRLYSVSLEAPTSTCKQFDLFGSLKQKFGEPKSTEIVDGKEMTPAVLPGTPAFKIWQNGVSTISFQESIGELDACSTSFELDAVARKVEKLEWEEQAREEARKKKDM